MDFYYSEPPSVAEVNEGGGYCLTSGYDMSSVSSYSTKAESGGHFIPGRTSPGHDLGYHTLLTKASVTSTPNQTPTTSHRSFSGVGQQACFSPSLWHDSPRSSPFPVCLNPSSPMPRTQASRLSPFCCNALSDTEKLLATFKGKKAPKTSHFDRLTDDIILKIFSFLSSNQLCVCARVCRRWYFLAWEPQLWTNVVLGSERIQVDRGLKTLFRLLCRDSPTLCLTVDRITLNGCIKLSDKGLCSIARSCPELRSLEIKGCSQVTNAGVCEITTRCLNLERLDVTGCYQVTTIQPRQITVSIEGEPDPLTTGPRHLYLQHLDLTDCHILDDSGLKIIVRCCPQLTHLYLRRCVQVTDTGVKFLASYCIMLRELSVSDCIQVTDFGMYELAKLGPNLRYLSVAKCDQISDAGIKQIARHCYKLRYLNVRGCEAVSDDSIGVLARSCPRLRALDIGKCDVTDQGLKLLSEHCPNLKKLSVKSCELLSDKGIQSIAYYCRGLQQLNIQDCPITIDGYRVVKKHCKRCIIEHTNPGFY